MVGLLWRPDAIAQDTCVKLESGNTILVQCDLHLREVAERVAAPEALRRVDPGEWLLSANLTVAPGATLTFDSTDGAWLKISRSATTIPLTLTVKGKLILDGVKVTSWDPLAGAVVEQDSEGTIVRPGIAMVGSEGCTIRNSEIAYLGYHNGGRGGRQAVRFVRSSNGVIEDNLFHHNWYAFYSDHAAFITIAGNEYRENYRYAIDPHTESHDFLIRGNHIHHNQGIGAICSQDCWNIVFDGNVLHDNSKVAIMFSRNTTRSVARNNVVYNQEFGISIGESPDNEVYGNRIFSSHIGIFVNPGPSTRNRIHDNSIQDTVYGIRAGSSTGGTEGNAYSSNHFKNVNQMFHLLSGSTVDISRQRFDGAALRGMNGVNNVNISQSGIIEVDGVRFDTDQAPFQARLEQRGIRIQSLPVRRLQR